MSTTPPESEAAAAVPPDAGGTLENGSKQAHPTDPNRWADGTLRVGNRAAETHGVYSSRRREPPADPLRPSLDDFTAGILSDLGGVGEISTITRGYVSQLQNAEIVVRLLTSDFAQRGLFTPRGRVRSSYSKLVQAILLWDRLAQRLGAERRPKHVSAYDALLDAVEEANR
jgi:hypothetical protein